MLKKYKLIAYGIMTALLLQVFAISPAVVFAADLAIGTDGSFTYKLVQDTGLNGYKLEIENNGTVVWTSPNGPVGIRTIDANNNVSAFQYKAYNTVAANGSAYIGTTSFTTANGSTINIEDRYTYIGGKINISRRSTVATANQNDKGFMTTLVVRSSAAKQPTDYKWFAPSMWYGNDSDNFTDRSRAAFKGYESSLAVDSLSVPLISNYDTSTGLSLSIADATNGRMETVDADMNVNGKVIVDDRINVAGLGLRNVTSGSNNYTEMFQSFPGYTRNWQGAFGDNQVIWRFSPMTANSIKNSAIQLSLKSYADFNTSFKTRWRDGYDNVTDNYQVDVQSAFEELVEYIDRGYTSNPWDNVYKPIYMWNTNHPTWDSGFINRAVDLASIMLWAGNYYGNQQYLTRAREVIDYQVNNNLVYNGYSRAYAEGVQNLLKAYIVDKNKNGVTNTSWYNYVISKVDTDWISPSGVHYNDKFAIPLLIEVYNYTMDAKYLNRAIAIGDDQWTGGWNTLRFRGGVTDYGPSGVCFDREMAGKAFESYMGLYNATLVNKWLDRAKIAADFLETWQIRANLQMTPFNTNQYVTDQISMGNDIKAYGLSYVNAGSASIDTYTINWVPEFYKLYQATGDMHYKDFANDVLYNSLEYVNMNDKISGLSDNNRDSGIGFTAEVLWSTMDRERYWWNRGKGHADNVPWVPYTMMTAIQQLKDLTGYWGLDGTTYPTKIKKYEAEDAALSGGAVVATDRYGRTGAAFVGGYSNPGATTTFTVNVPAAGNYRAVIRYGAAYNDRRNSLYVNGSKIGVLTFPNTPNWDTWADRPVDLSLNSGSNTIAIKYDTGDNGNINLDNLIIIPLDQKYEAEEEATLVGQSAVTNGSGNYSGTGFVGWTETLGSGIRFTFNVTNDGNYILKTRYAAGNANKTMSLYINGVKIKQAAFNKTADWNTWADENETIFLRSGLNTVEYRYDTGDTGNINLDYIVVSPSAKRLEAEFDAARGGGVSKDYVGSGYSGGAYLKVPAQQGAIVSFNTTIPEAKTEKLSMIYSAGAGAATANLYVDGTKIKQISLNGTAHWNAYALREDRVALTAGFHTIEYKIDSGDSGNFHIDSLELSEVTPSTIPAGTNALLNNRTASANAYFVAGPSFSTVTPNENPTLAVDGTNNSKWCTNANFGAQWLQIDIGQTVTLDRWVVKHAGSAGESSSLNTKVFKLQKSDDGSTWYDVDSVTGNTANITDRTVPIFTARFVRLYVTAPTQTSDQHSRIYEFEVYTTTDMAPYQVAVTPDSVKVNTDFDQIYGVYNVPNGVQSVALTANYDSEALQFVSAEPVEQGSGLEVTVDSTSTPGQVTLILSGNSGTAISSGNLLKLHWRTTSTQLLSTQISTSGTITDNGGPVSMNNADNSITLYADLTSITVSGANGVTSITENRGTLQMQATLAPTNATTNITWTVTDTQGAATDLASITVDGKLSISGNGKNGTVKVTASANDGSGIKGEALISIIGQLPKITGTPFGLGPSWETGREYDKVFDGDVNTFFDYSKSNDGYTGIDLGEGNAKAVRQIRFYPRSGFSDRMVGGRFQGSNTSPTSGFVTLYTVTSNPALQWNVASVLDPTAYRYLRYLSPAGGYCNIAEIEFYSPAPLVNSIEVHGLGGSQSITEKGGTLQMTAAVLPADASDKSITWSVMNPDGTATNVAAIDTNGILSAMGEGKVKVVATANDGSGVYGESLVTIDTESPVTSALITPPNPNGLQGWYTSPITVTLSANDAVSGVAGSEYSLDGGTTWIAYTDPFSINQDGSYTINYRSTDVAGHVEATKTANLKLDETAPAIVLLVPESFMDSESFTPAFTTTDISSGIDASQTQITLDGQPLQPGNAVPLYTLELGTHTVIVTAADQAGNVSSATAVFQVKTSLSSLQSLISDFVAMGWIDNSGIANSLQAKLDNGNLNSFIHEVSAQNGQHIANEAAVILLRDAQELNNAP